MKSGETSLGGNAKDFPKTATDLISRAKDPSEGIRHPALEEICRKYWKPIYSHIRLAWGKPNEDAKDLTQAFLLWIVEGDALTRYAQERASFRTYLKTLLRNFVRDQEDALRRLKRGGGVRFLDLEHTERALSETFKDARAINPEQVFDKVWKVELVRGAVEAVGERLKSTGRALQFQVFEEYDGSGAEKNPTYTDIAKRFDLKESDVANYLAMVREAIGHEIKAELSKMTSTPEELEEEWNALFGF
jgi:DNA-directed RNA polymerase specialized sigma24 family protein